MGEHEFHYFIKADICDCGHGVVEILNFVNQDIAPVNGLIQALIIKRNPLIVPMQASYKVLCPRCQRSYDCYFTRGSDRIQKISTMVGA